MDESQSSLMEGTAYIFPGQAIYMKLPDHVVRGFVDRVFEKWAINQDADVVSGYGHRWKAGHDAFVDVPRTLIDHGPIRALDQLAHIALTDFPTKAGIPIPGLSGSSSLGQWLNEVLVDNKVSQGYLSMHWADGAFGFLCISEGSTDLIQAIHGTLAMNAMTFYDTFVEGSLEIALALWAKGYWGVAAFNPALAIVGGIENILAGMISVYQTASVYVDPLAFFGSAGTSALIGFGLAYGVAGESLRVSSVNAIRGGTVGAFYSLSPAFGYGALAGFIAYKLGRKLAETHNKSIRVLMSVDENCYQQLFDELCKGNVHLKEFLDRAELQITLADTAVSLPTESGVLNSSGLILSDQFQLLDSNVQVFPENTYQLKSNVRTLPDDSPILSDWYRNALSC